MLERSIGTAEQGGRIYTAGLTDQLRFSDHIGSHIDFDLRMSPALADELSDLSRELGEPPGKVLAKAIALYRMAIDARAHGDRMAIIDGQLGGVKTEITGF